MRSNDSNRDTSERREQEKNARTSPRTCAVAVPRVTDTSRVRCTSEEIATSKDRVLMLTFLRGPIPAAVRSNRLRLSTHYLRLSTMATTVLKQALNRMSKEDKVAFVNEAIAGHSVMVFSKSY